MLNKIGFTNYISILLCIFLFSSSIAIADDKSWTVDDVLNLERISTFEISPDGKYVLWNKTQPCKEKDKYIRHIYRASLKDGLQIQMTRGKTDNVSPKWSPDGKYIAFISARDKKKIGQIWLMAANGGEPWQLTTLENGVQSFAWEDATRIIFSARENKTLYEKELKKNKDATIVVGDDEHYWPVRLFRLQINSKEIRRLTTNSGVITEFKISPDSKWLVSNENQSVHYAYDNKIPPRQFLLNLKTLKREEIFTDKGMKPFNYVWAMDGKGFYCSQPFSSTPQNDYVSVSTLYYFDVAGRKYKKVNLNWKWELGFFGYFPTQNGLLVSLANGTLHKWAFYQKAGKSWKKRDLNDSRAGHILINAVSKDGRSVVYTHSSASNPGTVYAADVKNRKFKNEHKIIGLNTFLEKKRIARSEVISWKGALGDKVEGVLYYPHEYEKDKKYALMVSIHGGPAGVDMDAFSDSWANYPNILAGKGAFVLRVNYHGSGNYGLKWVESIKNHYYEYEVPDILSGVDYLIGKGMVDPDRLGIMGWSNGAILATQCTIETERFKVCAAGAGDVNWTSDYGNCKFGAGFDNAYFGGPPWEKPDYYVQKSPLFKMEKVSTPTFICFGTIDTNVPTEQGWQHYRALQQIGKTPVRFLLFPGEIHVLQKLSHLKRKMEEELIWFDKYLFKTRKKSEEWYKKDSPLASLLDKASVAAHNELYGLIYKDLLIPETVNLDSIKISRFEITRAQFAKYYPQTAYSESTGNFPVNNVSFVEAQNYCNWLSKITGKKYRLPKEKEFRGLLKIAAKEKATENTLDYWAGYSPTPDETLKLQEKIKNSEKISLIKEVGSFKASLAKKNIYDLSGNVAEWCYTKDGKGLILGGSAFMPSDPKAEYKAPFLQYVGFRVVLEK